MSRSRSNRRAPYARQHCIVCRKQIRQPEQGRPRRTCSDRCRQNHARARKSRWLNDYPQFKQRRRNAFRKLAGWERRFGPLDPELRSRIIVRLSRGIRVFNCVVCDRPFIFNGYGFKYCSAACRNQTYYQNPPGGRRLPDHPILEPLPHTPDMQTVIDLRARRGWPLWKCPVCHRPFIKYTLASPGRNATYCSPRCTHAAWRYRRNVKYRTCQHCGDRYRVTYHTANANKQRYCSKSCKKKASYHRARNPRPIRHCIVCNAPFPLTKTTRLYCSTACRHEMERRRRLHDESPRLDYMRAPFTLG